MNNRNLPLFKCLGMLLALSMLFTLPTAVLAAESYPSKPVRLIIAFAPGGGTDIIGRMIAPKLAERLGNQVIVENRAGGGSVIGTEMAANAKPDGYTLFLATGSHTIQPALQKLPYDPLKSFTPIALLVSLQQLLVVHPSVTANSVKEFIGLAKQKPGKIFLATAGAGSFSHMGAELLRIMADIDVRPVHFKGGGPAMIDVLGGHSHAIINSIPSIVPHVRSGKVRVLGVGGAKRSVILPDVPTIAESGVPGYGITQWIGLLAPAGTPTPIVERLSNEIKVILSSDEVKKRFLTEGAEADYMSPAEYGSFIAQELTQWARVVKKANIKLEE